MTRRGEPQTIISRFLCQWGFDGSPTMGHAMGVVTCDGSCNGWGHVSRVITWVGSCVRGSLPGGVMYGVTLLILGPPILGRVVYVQNSLLDKVSVAGSKVNIVSSGPKKP